MEHPVITNETHKSTQGGDSSAATPVRCRSDQAEQRAVGARPHHRIMESTYLHIFLQTEPIFQRVYIQDVTGDMASAQTGSLRCERSQRPNTNIYVKRQNNHAEATSRWHTQICCSCGPKTPQIWFHVALMIRCCAHRHRPNLPIVGRPTKLV
ncbi:unnamed protein product [Ectocarpus sp. 4 AP-2014]